MAILCPEQRQSNPCSRNNMHRHRPGARIRITCGIRARVSASGTRHRQGRRTRVGSPDSVRNVAWQAALGGNSVNKTLLRDSEAYWMNAVVARENELGFRRMIRCKLMPFADLPRNDAREYHPLVSSVHARASCLVHLLDENHCLILKLLLLPFLKFDELFDGRSHGQQKESQQRNQWQ